MLHMTEYIKNRIHDMDELVLVVNKDRWENDDAESNYRKYVKRIKNTHLFHTHNRITSLICFVSKIWSIVKVTYKI